MMKYCRFLHMSDPSPSKSGGKKMKCKYQKYLNMFPESSVKTNVEFIRDTKIGHINMNEFMEHVEKAPAKMTNVIANGLHQYASFLVATHDPNIVLAAADHFDAKTR